MKTTMLSILLLLNLFSFGQTTSKNYKELTISGGIPTGGLAYQYNFNAGGCIRYYFYGKETSGFDFSLGIPVSISIGGYGIFSKKNVVDTSGKGVKSLFVLPIMFGFRMDDGHKYSIVEFGYAYATQSERHNNGCFSIEYGLRIKKTAVGISFSGIAGKEKYFVGMAMLNLHVPF